MAASMKPFQCLKRQCTKAPQHRYNMHIVTLRTYLGQSSTKRNKILLESDVLEHTLNRKEAYLSKTKQMKESSNEWKPSLNGQYTPRLQNCQSGKEVLQTLKQIEKEMKVIPDARQYVTAIRKSADLRDYSMCFQLFEDAKQLQRIDERLYAAIIWVCAQQRSVSSLKKGIELYVEMQEIYKLQPSIAIYNHLLLLCVNTMEYNKGKHIWKELRSNKSSHTDKSICGTEFGREAPNLITYNIMIDLYCKCDEMHKAVDIFKKLWNGEYGEDMRPNYVIYTTLMRAFSKHGEIDSIELLFSKCMKTHYIASKQHNEENEKQILMLTQCLLDSYANIGNVDECVNLIQHMMQREKACTNEENGTAAGIAGDIDWTYFPTPNIQIFTCVLKALTRCKDRKKKNRKRIMKASVAVDHESAWTIISWCLQCIDALGIAKDAVFYGNLLHLCGDLYGNADLEQAMKFYQEMKENERIKVGELQLFNLLKTGQQYHHHHKSSNAERKTFVQFIVSELEQQEIVPSVQLRKLITTMMAAVNAHEIDVDTNV